MVGRPALAQAAASRPPADAAHRDPLPPPSPPRHAALGHSRRHGDWQAATGDLGVAETVMAVSAAVAQLTGGLDRAG